MQPHALKNGDRTGPLLLYSTPGMWYRGLRPVGADYGRFYCLTFFIYLFVYSIIMTGLEGLVALDADRA